MIRSPKAAWKRSFRFAWDYIEVSSSGRLLDLYYFVPDADIATDRDADVTVKATGRHYALSNVSDVCEYCTAS